MRSHPFATQRRHRNAEKTLLRRSFDYIALLIHRSGESSETEKLAKISGSNRDFVGGASRSSLPLRRILPSLWCSLRLFAPSLLHRRDETGTQRKPCWFPAVSTGKLSETGLHRRAEKMHGANIAQEIVEAKTCETIRPNRKPTDSGLRRIPSSSLSICRTLNLRESTLAVPRVSSRSPFRCLRLHRVPGLTVCVQRPQGIFSR